MHYPTNKAFSFDKSRETPAQNRRRCFFWSVICLVATIAVSCGVRLATAEPPASRDASESKAWIGRSVTVEMKSGKKLADHVLETIRPGKVPGTYASLKLQASDTNITAVYGAGVISKVLLDGETILAFDEATKSLASPDEKKLDVIHKAATSLADKEKSATDSSSRSTPTAKKPKVGKDRKGKAKKGDIPYTDEELAARATEEGRITHYRKTGVYLWEEITDEVYKAELEKRKDYIKKVSEHFSSLNMRLHETKYFLFLTDIPDKVATQYTSCLDKMHAQLCEAYGLKNQDQIWLGKLPVIAFTNPTSFAEHERKFFKLEINPNGVQGLCHNIPDGNVVVSCHCGKDPHYFAAVVVHETTHGFNYRYKSNVAYPCWLEEGIAEWSAMTTIRDNRSLLQKAKQGVAIAKKQGSLGGDYFPKNEGDKINAWQYGIALSMADFLIKTDAKSFRKMLDAIKSGMKWQEALKKYYRWTPEELVQKFGLTVGIRDLKP